MGSHVYINVCFDCDDNDAVAEVARRHLTDDLEDRDARQFLEDLTKRTGLNHGPKGGLTTWGMIGNWTIGEEFVSSLKPFWLDLLLSDLDGGPLSFHNIMVFVEREQTGHAAAFEVSLDDISEPAELRIKEHVCPFAWMPR